jgi:hypothetical protein
MIREIQFIPLIYTDQDTVVVALIASTKSEILEWIRRPSPRNVDFGNSTNLA